MALTPIDKIKIFKFFKDNPIGEIYYLDLCDALGKRGKIKDIEFLEFFVDVVINEFKKTEKISMKQVNKFVMTIESFLEWVNHEGTEVSEILIDKIRSFDEYYKQYLEVTGLETDPDFVDYLDSLLKKVDELYPKKVSDESVVPYLNQIEELKSNFSVLKREYDSLTKLYEDLQDKYEKRNSEFLHRCDENNRLLNNISNKERDISKLEESIQALEEKIAELEKVISDLNGDLDYYKPYKEAYDILFLEVGKLREEIDVNLKIQCAIEKENELNEKLVSAIYMCLIDGKQDINGIIDYLFKNEGIRCDRAKVSFLLSQLKQKINIVSDTFTLSPSYRVEVPLYLQDKIFTLNVPYGSEYYDILLVSDFHLKEFDSKTLNSFDVINNYCVNNNINLIMNLGDFFDGIGGSKRFDYTCAMENYKLVESAISVIPRTDGIYHAVLGGNHDKGILRYGFDPIKVLSDEREDFINLGYTHSTIAFNGFYGILGQFDIHHPHTFDFPIDFTSSGLDTEKLNSHLDMLYGDLGRSRDDSYIDIFGHTHKSQFNYPESYCFLPSLTEGKSKRGACHLRVYFEDNMNIKYMLFMPLSVNDKLIKNNEIVYKKILSR